MEVLLCKLCIDLSPLVNCRDSSARCTEDTMTLWCSMRCCCTSSRTAWCLHCPQRGCWEVNLHLGLQGVCFMLQVWYCWKEMFKRLKVLASACLRQLREYLFWWSVWKIWFWELTDYRDPFFGFCCSAFFFSFWDVMWGTLAEVSCFFLQLIVSSSNRGGERWSDL